MDLSELFFNRNLDNLGLHNSLKNKICSFPSDNLPISYKINSYGYRGEEFDGSSEVLVLGCSQTFGSGMMIEHTWADIFCKHIQKTYSNLACLGDSLQGQVYKAFKYFEEFGNPRIIVGCFPLLRMEMPVIPKKFKKIHGGVNSLGIEMAYLYGDVSYKISKEPHDPESILPGQAAILYNFMLLQILEQYCKSHNILFIWSIWDSKNVMKFAKENFPYLFKNSVAGDIFNYKIDKSGNLYYDYDMIECHKDLSDSPLFKFAADWDPKNDRGHWGIHMHLHVAETFKDAYERLKND